MASFCLFQLRAFTCLYIIYLLQTNRMIFYVLADCTFGSLCEYWNAIPSIVCKGFSEEKINAYFISLWSIKAFESLLKYILLLILLEHAG